MSASMTRRQLLRGLALAGTCMAVPGHKALAELAKFSQPSTWRNWSGTQSCMPKAWLFPKDLAELVQVMKTAPGVIRPVGSGHSFSPLVPTEGTLLSMGFFSGLLGHEVASHEAEFAAATLMSQVGPALQSVGQALPNMADIDYQTLAGAIATSTHGTGLGYGSYSTQISGLQLVSAQGEVLDCSASQNTALFDCARVSLGALGVVTKVRLKNRSSYRLKEHQWIARTDELLEQADSLRAQNQHWEMLVITHSDYALSVSLNETTEDKTPPLPADEEGGNEFVSIIENLDKYTSDFPSLRRRLLNSLRFLANFDDRVDESFEIYANPRTVRFNEMEYSVPAEHGPACLREILALIKKGEVRTWFPIEYRYVKGDDIPLSMFEGGDRCAISVHQHYAMDYQHYFAAVEPIFWKYGGRPHWGKLHSLTERQLRTLYPKWEQFARLRRELDPQRRLVNAHLAAIFGV